MKMRLKRIFGRTSHIFRVFVSLPYVASFYMSNKISVFFRAFYRGFRSVNKYYSDFRAALCEFKRSLMLAYSIFVLNRNFQDFGITKIKKIPVIL
jgi:hypothetical protein